MLSLISGILDLSKVEAGKLETESRPVSVGAVVANVDSIISATAASKNIRVRSESGDTTPPVMGDPARIQQCLLNLASNAVKFSPDNGIVTIRALVVQGDDDRLVVRFEVEDEGIGVSSSQLEKLFSPFEQADSSISRKYGGSGLGLVLTKRLANLMGGDAGATSIQGVGSTFWFTVSLRKATSEEVAILSEAAKETDRSARNIPSGKRVLLVEDDPINQEIGTMLLRDLGLAVDVASDGEIAITMLTERQYHLVLMDMQMPRMDGLAATRMLRADGRHTGIPIIAMTANAFLEDRHRCFEAGMDDFLSKPIIPGDLEAVLKKWIG